MTKEDKISLVDGLVETMQSFPNLYIADTGGMSVAEVNELRRVCFHAGIKMQVVKNTLIRKAMERTSGDGLAEAYPHLKQTSAVFFASVEAASAPAKMLKEFRKTHEKPTLKLACIDTAVFVGHNQLDALTALKTKGELIGEVLGLLQSPARNVISALQSGGSTIAGLVKTLSEREG